MIAPSSRPVPATLTDRQIAGEIVEAEGLSRVSAGLRFDRVVTRVLGKLRRFADGAVPAGSTVLVAITAPIRTPAKTGEHLEHEIGALLSAAVAGADRTARICGNDVRLRLVRNAAKRAHRLIGFVHNANSDAARLLDMAERWLRTGA